MRRLPISLMLVAILGIATLGGFAVAQDTPATPEVVQPGTPEILPELCPTTETMGTPVDLAASTPAGGEATPALFQCATPGAEPAAAAGLHFVIIMLCWRHFLTQRCDDRCRHRGTAYGRRSDVRTIGNRDVGDQPHAVTDRDIQTPATDESSPHLEPFTASDCTPAAMKARRCKRWQHNQLA